MGELLDKIAILEIKESRITDAEKLVQIRHELSLLQSLKNESSFSGEELAKLSAELKLVNSVLGCRDRNPRA